MQPPIAREGIPFVLGSLFVTIVLYALDLTFLSFQVCGLTLFIAYFFRNPVRVIPRGDDNVVSPADGKVIKVEEVHDDRILNGNALKISIFMNVFNVHINRVPASGRVLSTHYNPGKFFNASLDKASLHNEQNALLIEAVNKKRYVVNQIAGLVARRIISYPEAGNALNKGEKYGLIRFGSRLDLYMPEDFRPIVKVGDHVTGGESIVGYWE